MKRKYICYLSLILISVLCIFTGCNDVNTRFNFDLSETEINIILGETTSQENAINNSVEITVEKKEAGDNDNVWVSVLNESIVNVKQTYNSNFRTKYLVTGLMPGSAVVRVYSVINSEKYKDIKVNVYQQIESVNFAKQDDIFIAFGSTYAIKADSELNLSPVHSAKSDLRYSITEFEGVTINEETGVIDATNATSVGTLTVKVYGKNNPQNFDTKLVHIVRPIEQSFISIEDAGGAEVVNLGEVVKPKIELVKTVEDLSYSILNLTCTEYDVSALDIRFSNFDNNVVQIDVKDDGLIWVKSVAIGTSSATLEINVKNAVGYLPPAVFNFDFSVIDIPNAININGEKVINEKVITIYDRYNNGVLGESIRFSLSPSSVLDEDATMVVTYNTDSMIDVIKFIRQDGSVVEVVNKSFTVSNNEVLFIRANSGTNDTCSFTISSPKANLYNKNIDCTLTVNVLTGIDEITISPSALYLQKGESTNISLDIVPSNADLSAFYLSTLSNKIEINAIDATTYNVQANDVTNETLYVYYKNGGYAALDIVSYNPLEYFKVEVDSIYSNSGIGKKEYDNQNLLKKIWVQLGYDVKLHLDYGDATITEMEHFLSSENVISYNNGIISAKREGTVRLNLIAIGYAGEYSSGAPMEYGVTLEIETYRAISSITLNRLSATVYDYSSVGFYNKARLSQLNLVANVYPQNATYSSQVEWRVTNANQGGTVCGSVNTTHGNNTIFTGGPLNASDSETVIVTAIVKEFNREFTENCVITVKKAKAVNSIVLSNIFNNNLYFDSRKGLNTEDNSFNVEARAYPTDALNKNIRYLYLALEDEHGNFNTNDILNPIFKVDTSGRVIPLRAGTAVLRVASEDSFANATSASTYVDVYVKVADGKTKETAFHITTAEDLVSIGTDADTMSYYYVLTNTIDMSGIKEFEPIGQKDGLSFTGYLSGTYEFSSPSLGQMSIKSSIINLSISESFTTSNINECMANGIDEINIGLFAKISTKDYVKSTLTGDGYDTMPRTGTIENLQVYITSLKVDCSNVNILARTFNVNVGTLAGRFKVDGDYLDERNLYLGECGIKNVSVVIGEFEYKVGGNHAYVGGLVGRSDGDIIYTNKMNAVSGNDIIIRDKKSYERVGGADQIEYNSFYYVGGLVGQNDGVIKSTFNNYSNNGNNIALSALLGNEGIDVTANINNRQNGASVPNLESTNGNVGGLVGQNTGLISNTSTDNIVIGFYNVGGLVGTNYGNGVIENSFSSSIVRGTTNVGGLIGLSAGDVTNCYVQSYENNVSGDLASNVKGATNVGGLVGKVNGGTLEFVYSATYKERTISNINSINTYAGDVVGETNVGGLVGNVGGSTEIKRAYTNFVATFNNGNMSSMIGSNSAALNISDSYMITNYNIVTFIDEPSSTNSSINSYIKYKVGGEEKVKIFGSAGSVVGNYESFTSEEIDGELYGWCKQDEFPYLLYKGMRFVQEPPEEIQIVIDKCAINQTSMLLFYYTSDDINDRAILENYNIYDLSNIISITVLPASGYVNRLSVSSDNERVIKVLDNGMLQVVGTGNAKIRLASKLSTRIYKEFDIYVTYPVLQFNIYETANVLDENAQIVALRIKKGENKQIRPYITANVQVHNSNNYILAKIADEIYLEYQVYIDNKIASSDSLGITFTDLFTFENSTYLYDDLSSKVYGVFKDYYLSQIINAIESTANHKVAIQCRPYLIIDGNKVYLSELDCVYDNNGAFSNFNASAFDKQFNLNVYVGATDFVLISEENTTVTAGTQVDICAKLFTDDYEDGVYVSILDKDNKIVSSYNNGVLNSNVFTILNNSLSPINVDSKDFVLSLKLNDANKVITENTTYTIILSAKSEPLIRLVFYLTFIPNNIERVDTKFYTYAEKDLINGGEYYPYEETSSILIPGYNALLSINVFPSYADYDFIELTNSNLSFAQVVKNDMVTNDYPYEALADRNYLVNGITLVNAYIKNGQLVYGKNGEYYATVLASSNIAQPNQNITITAYKMKNGVKTAVFTQILPISCLNLPEVQLSYNGDTNKNNNEVYVPHGTEIEVGVALFDYVGNVDFSITKYNETTGDYDVYPYASISNKTGKYILSVSTLARAGDVIRLSATITKNIGKITSVATDTLEFIVVDYCILDIGFENVYNNKLNEVFGGSYLLKLSFENSKFFYDTNDESVKAKIISDLQAISTTDYSTWYAYKASSSKVDVGIGRYYKNAYIEITTKSRVSKDLYVSGVQYDSKDSNQKRIAAKVKYSFDRATKCWVFEKSGIEDLNRSDNNLNSLLTAKFLQNGKIYQVLDKVFTVDLYLNSNRENAVPIYNEEDFMKMQSGINYIQMVDLTFEEFTPITAQIESYNGNNHTITLSGYKDETELESRSGVKNIGLFSEISEGAIFENIKLIIGTSSAMALDIDAKGYSEVVFGLLAGVNNGTIYNCSVSYAGEASTSALVSRMINGQEYTYPYDYAILLSDNNILTSGNVIPGTAKGVKVNITLDTVSDSFVRSTMGILVGENSGYITNGRIEKGVQFNGYGSMGAIAGKNLGTISSSYSKAVIYSYTSVSDYSKVGGLVGDNSGRIALSFVEGMFNLLNKSNVAIEINAITRVGGFVYENKGSINDCYSNVRINSNSSTAGFVFINSGTIKNTYSTSIIRENSLQDSAYIGVDQYNNVNNSGTIESSYFLKGNYTNQAVQPVTMIENALEFNEINTFDSFAFDTDLNGNPVLNSTKGVWFIPNGNMIGGAYQTQEFIPNKPTLVSANLVSTGYVDLLTVSTSNGQPEYIYTSLIDATLGSIYHPYVIYNASEFNKYILEPGDGTNTKFYVLARDIDFSDEAVASESYKLVFSGNFEGNAMKINKLKVSYLNSSIANTNIESLGMFKKVVGATIKNVTISVNEIYGSTATAVGAIAGIVENSKLYGINLTGDAVVHGKNIAGGLAGKVVNSVVRDVDSELSVNASYRDGIRTYLYDNASSEIESKVSYAGGIIGVLVNSLAQSLNVTSGYVIAENVGGVFGLIDKNSKASRISVYVNSDMYIKGLSLIGGITAENRGKLNRSMIQYENEVQEIIDGGTAVGSFNSLANNSYYVVGTNSATLINYKAPTIGGLVGLNNGGTISNSYSRVNIYDTNAVVAGGIAGRSLEGSISKVYAKETIYIGYSDATVDYVYDDNTGAPIATSLYYKFIGGIVGSVANNIIYTERFANALKEDSNTHSKVVNTDVVNPLALNSNNGGLTNYLSIDNAISLVSFDCKLIADYDKMKIGGIIGLIGLLPYNNASVYKSPVVYGDNEFNQTNIYNKVIYNTYNPKVTNGSHIAKNDIPSVSILSNSANSLMTVIGTSDGQLDTSSDNSSSNYYGLGYEYLQMTSDGDEEIDKVTGKVTYVDWKRGNNYVSGVKTEIFLFHTMSDFEFKSREDATPIINSKKVNSFKFSSIFERVSNVSYEAYYVNSVKDLEILSRIVNFGYKDCENISFVLANDIDFNYREFEGIGTSNKPFKGTINGNKYTIKNIGFGNNSNYLGFINYGIGARIINIAFNNVTFNIPESSNAKYVGLVAYGTGITINKVSMQNVNISNAKANIDAFGVLAGAMSGNVVSSYVVVGSLEFKAIGPTTNLTLLVNKTPIASGSPTAVEINNCYSVLDLPTSKAKAEPGLTVSIYGIISACDSQSSIVNTFTYLDANNEQPDTANPLFSLTQYGGSPNIKSPLYFRIRSGSTYLGSPNNNIKFKDPEFFKDDNTGIWYNDINPWWDVNNNVPNDTWVLEDDMLPYHRWDTYKPIQEQDNEELGYSAVNRKYSISTVAQLRKIAKGLADGSIANGGDGYVFELQNDIDLAGENITLGSFANPFKGTFRGVTVNVDGNEIPVKISNYTQTINISNNQDYSFGFFGRIDGALISSVIFENARIIITNENAENTGKIYTGIIAGISNASTISGITINNPIIQINSVNNPIYLGGMVGYVESSTITNCEISNIIISISSSSESVRVGGIVGYIKAQNVHIESNKVNTFNNTNVQISLTAVINNTNINCGALFGCKTNTSTYSQVINNECKGLSYYNLCGSGSIDASNRVVDI